MSIKVTEQLKGEVKLLLQIKLQSSTMLTTKLGGGGVDIAQVLGCNNDAKSVAEKILAYFFMHMHTSASELEFNSAEDMADSLYNWLMAICFMDRIFENYIIMSNYMDRYASIKYNKYSACVEFAVAFKNVPVEEACKSKHTVARIKAYRWAGAVETLDAVESIMYVHMPFRTLSDWTKPTWLSIFATGAIKNDIILQLDDDAMAAGIPLQQLATNFVKTVVEAAEFFE